MRFNTPDGEIWLHGEAGRLDRQEPVVLAIAGLFAPTDAPWFRLQAHLRGVTVLAAHLPGNHCPQLREISVAAYARAFEHAIDQLLPGRPVLVCGESLGGTVALAVKGLNLRRVALDPPLRTAQLWPLRPVTSAVWKARPDQRDFLSSILGYDGRAMADRDYVPLVVGPARVIVGTEPLHPERDASIMPSLVGEAERAALQARGVRITPLKGAGHVVRGHAALQIIMEELTATPGHV